MPFVVVREEEAPAPVRGRPRGWRRWIEVRIPARGSVFGFTVDAQALALAPETVLGRAEILRPGFAPLAAERTVRVHGADHRTMEPAPGDVEAVALEACRAAALRLYSFGVDRVKVTHPWPRGLPTFASIVKGVLEWPAVGEGGQAPDVPLVPYPKRPGAARRRKRWGRSFP